MGAPEYGEREIEQDIKAKELTAPRITPAELDDKITAELYHIFPGTTLTVCCLILQNGFAVAGQSGRGQPAEF
jgi:Phage protein (N4 Gp49/phage Sf6 gene 66) family